MSAKMLLCRTGYFLWQVLEESSQRRQALDHNRYCRVAIFIFSIFLDARGVLWPLQLERELELRGCARQGVSVLGPCFIRNQVGDMGKLLPLASSFLTVTHGIMFIFFWGGGVVGLNSHPMKVKTTFTKNGSRGKKEGVAYKRWCWKLCAEVCWL